MEATYIGINMWKQAVEKAKSTDTDKVIAAMAGQTFKAPSGIVSKMDEKNHHLHKSVFIGEVKADGQFNVVWKTPGPVKAKPWSPFIEGNDKKPDEPALQSKALAYCANRSGALQCSPYTAYGSALHASPRIARYGFITFNFGVVMHRNYRALPCRFETFLAIATIFIASNAYSLTADTAKAIAVGEGDPRIEALRAAVTGADDKTVAFIQALSDDAVKVVGDRPVIVKDGKALTPSRGWRPHCRTPLKM
jgi:hypothetical protein